MSCMRFSTILLVVIVAPTEVFALAGGALAKPAVAVPAGSSIRQANKVLADAKYEFVTGSFLNSATTLFYRGDTRKLGFFLSELSSVKGTVVSLKFSRKRGWVDTTGWGPEGKAGAYQWRVFHMALLNGGRRFQVTVFLGDGKIDLEKLYIPPLRAGKPARKGSAKPSTPSPAVPAPAERKRNDKNAR
jgi:hypothetical protein